jgi:predicted HicB family RNase H-like nuclease
MSVEEEETATDEELIQTQIKRKQKKARLLKLRMAAINVPDSFGKPERRETIQKSKKTNEFNQAAGENALDKQTQDRVGAEVDFINKGTKIRPPKKPIDVKLRRKLARITKGNTTFDTLAPEDVDSVEDILKNVKPLKGSKPRKDSDPIPSSKPGTKVSKEQKLAKEHGHSIVFRGHPRGQFKIASLESQDKSYAKYFLLNAKQINGNGWGISQHTARENMQKFVGRPLVITSSNWHGASLYGESYEHPYLPTNDLKQIFAHQEQFRVGNIVGIDESKSGDFHAVVEMLPQFAGKRLPPFCSPAIFQLDAMEHEGNISKWEALHLAALDSDPAYGARVAILKGTCVGTSHACTVQFKSAKQIKNTGAIVCAKNYSRLKGRLAGISTHGQPKQKPPVITALGPRHPFRKTDQKALDKITNPFNQRGISEKDDPKKKQKLVAKLQKIAAGNVKDILRNSGRSVDGSHDQSTFLTDDGEFLGGGDIHDFQVKKITGNTAFGETATNDFLKQNNLIRVQNFPINKAGEKRMSFGINSKINQTQLKTIMDSEKGGKDIGFAVGNDVGRGSRDLVKALRKNNMLMGKKNASS